MTRIFDFVASLIAILIFWPLMLIVAIAIKLESKGPVLFKQKRLTMGIREFDIYKFRSMRTDFDKDGVGVQVKGGSNAITKVGKFIRKTKLDELPQLFNVLNGDMAIIGPRAELPRRLSSYTEWEKEIFCVRSGISSTASIVFSDEEYLMDQVEDPERFYMEQIRPYKIKLNHYYIKNKSFFYDMWLIIATVLKILKKIENKQVVKDEKLLGEHLELVEATKSY
ncbi:MAG: sugar transferase [Psychrilyobacter sp.]|uniref:sugar transferase n=1 Tax=Psychrilyobacter sp. TaxID=2586924 RepID=UPI003C71AC45